MTTPINTFQDILDALERNPALRDALRRHILTDELLQMPVRLERMEQDIASLKEGQARLEEGQARLEGDVSTLKEDVSTLKEEVVRIGGEVTRMGGTVSNLAGTDYESHVAANISRFLRRQLNTAATVFSTQKDKQPLMRLLDQAEAQGNITPEQNDRLNDVDLVLTVDDRGEYMLVEVSITVQQRDIQRAAEWAAILAQATGMPVTPLAIGTQEDPGLEKGDVQVLLVPQHQSA